MTEEYLKLGHLPPPSIESYNQAWLRHQIQQAKDELEKMNPKVDKSHITPLRDRKVTEKLISHFGGKIPETSASHENEPQEYFIKFNDKSRFILYLGNAAILADIVVKENLPERVIIDFTKMTENIGQQINSKYIVTQPVDKKPEAGTIYLRMYDLDKDDEYYRAHGIYPVIPAEDLHFSDKTMADLIQKGLLVSK